MNDFKNWRNITPQDIESFTNALVQEALRKKKTYKAAYSWVKANTPDTTSSYSANAQDMFQALIREIFIEAAHRIKDEAMNQEVKHE